VKRQLFLVLFISTATISHNIKAEDSQQLHNLAGTTNYLFTTIRTQLKNPTYAKEILPNDFTYLNQLLIYGHETNQDHTYFRSTFEIFSKVLGGAEYVNADAFVRLLTEFPDLLKSHCIPHKIEKFVPAHLSLDADMYDRFKESVNGMLYAQFSANYESFKDNPDQFLSDVSEHIVDMTQEQLNIERMRYSMLRFIEIGMNKLIWDTQKPETIWPNVKKIAHTLELMVQDSVIEDMNDLDDAFWTLVHRFTYFVDIVDVELPSSLHKDILHEIAHSEILLLDLEEQDSCIRTKKEVLTRVLQDAHVKTQAYEKGILIS
jgi:hypothetical protein